MRDVPLHKDKWPPQPATRFGPFLATIVQGSTWHIWSMQYLNQIQFIELSTVVETWDLRDVNLMLACPLWLFSAWKSHNFKLKGQEALDTLGNHSAQSCWESLLNPSVSSAWCSIYGERSLSSVLNLIFFRQNEIRFEEIKSECSESQSKGSPFLFMLCLLLEFLEETRPIFSVGKPHNRKQRKAKVRLRIDEWISKLVRIGKRIWANHASFHWGLMH